MKTTKIMLACIATFLFTAFFFGFLIYLLSDPEVTYRHIMQSGGIWMFMLVLGWIPAVVVGADLDDKLI